MSRPVIFLDIDGCILPEYGNVDEKYFDFLRIISRWAKGFPNRIFPEIRLSSGRDRNSVEIVSNLLGIVGCWQIIEGGAYLFNPTTREAKRHPAITLKIQKTFEMIKEKRMPQILNLYPYPGEITCITLVRNANMVIGMEKAYLIIRKELSDLIRKRLVSVRYTQQAIHIVPPRVSKGTAAIFLAELDGIDLSMSLAIGDSKSDIPLFKRVGRIGCPNNASEPCKEYVKKRRGKASLLNYAAGVADIIEWYFPE